MLTLLYGVRLEEELELSLSVRGDSIIVPEGFPVIDFPEGNEFTAARWLLGKRLFYDKRLSIDRSISCASCHQPAFAFADNQAFSDGVFGRSGERNAPSLANVAYHPYLLREGSVPTIEMQVLVPIQEEHEFNHNIVNIVKELKEDSIYKTMSIEAYDREMDAYVLTRALANFQRSMLSGNSAYDRYVYQKDSLALNQRQQLGMRLFFSEKTNCSQCHGGFNFTNYTFKNNGLDTVYKDVGRFRFTHDSSDLALFKVPSLRNVAYTAPYMHDGRFQTLVEVIEHYNTGGKLHKHKSEMIKPLLLSQSEKQSLVAFLEALSDHEFINNQDWRE